MKKVLVGCFSAFFSLLSLCAHAGTWTSGNTTITTSGSTVTVSGNGSMADYDYEFVAPWLTDAITSIVIEDGEMRVGKTATGVEEVHYETKLYTTCDAGRNNEGAFHTDGKRRSVRYQHEYRRQL